MPLCLSRLVAFLWPLLVTVSKLRVVLSILQSWISNLLVSVADVLWERCVVFSGVGAMSERECRHECIRGCMLENEMRECVSDRGI